MYVVEGKGDSHPHLRRRLETNTCNLKWFPLQLIPLIEI